jgi:LmbE family N-acetylglucosaminyl deacetylase
MSFDVIAFGAHPDDLEVSMGGTAVKLVAAGLDTLFVDLTDGEPARYAAYVFAGSRRHVPPKFLVWSD